ncbi:DUF1778 domain-containing protein [Teredinibacter turnerae]|uniref:type II toxin -antitoxin system TacA 1-like antitoxin n=1 Tax=Teredinibacter turnerae TaxID=2426 RepID=UPI00036A7268|nr:DUF1778 domain-containing protein [Teredinibacter turnerae]
MTAKKVDLHITLTPEVKLMAQKASALELMSVSEYISKLINNSAPSIIEQHTSIKISNKDFDNFANYFDKIKDIEIPDDFTKYRDDDN